MGIAGTKEKRMHRLLGLGVCVVLFGLAGCGRPETPPGMPELSPLTITVIQDGQPLAEASIALYEEGSKWAVGGSTDVRGRAVIRTLGKYLGAPAGTYRVCFWKELSEGGGAMSNDPSARAEPVVYYDLIDEKFKLPATTPFTLTVAAGQKNTETFDVGKAIKKRLASPH